MRINTGIPVTSLTDEHLLAEHREIPMMVHYRKICENKHIPEVMNLGKGYARFFLNKASYLVKRYRIVHEECIRRGFRVDNKEGVLCVFGENQIEWSPNSHDAALIRDRIIERIKESPKDYFHYHHIRITKESAIELLQ